MNEPGRRTMPSVLDHAGREAIRTDPFPHLVLENALPAADCRALVDSFPGFRDVAWDGPAPSNKRFPMPAFTVLLNRHLPAVWRDFVQAHTSRDFLRRVHALFAGYWTPAAERVWAGLEQATLGLVQRDDADILTDARIELNTPVTDRPGSVRGGHLDTPNRLFSALYYLRAPGDDTPGGDLALYRFRGPAPAERLDRFAFADDELIEVTRVPYAANTLVIFPNRPTALHGVTPRPLTPWQRNYVFITAEVAADLF